MPRFNVKLTFKNVDDKRVMDLGDFNRPDGSLAIKAAQIAYKNMIARLTHGTYQLSATEKSNGNQPRITA